VDHGDDGGRDNVVAGETEWVYHSSKAIEDGVQNSQSSSAPKVSVIIPSYKTADLIASCLDSVLAQTYKDFEAVVVNDGSPDTPELEKVLEPYMDRIVYIKQENKRAAGARNNAIRHARGEFVAFLDSDDTWLPDHLASQMQMFAEDPSLDLTYSNALLVGDPNRTVSFMEQCPSKGVATFDALIVERCQIPVSTVVARKRTIVNAGLFDEKLLRCDDYDMWVRSAFSGAKIGYNRKLQARIFNGRPGSLGLSRAKMVEAYWIILEKLMRTLPLQDSDRQVVEGRAVEIRARYLLEEGKCRLEDRQFDKAKELFSEANGYLRRPWLTLTVFGLSIAPDTTTKLIAFRSRILNGARRG
jgi:glycosyltransferase involved in cell wall biosynthesis